MIAKRLQPLAKREDVQPAVVVVIGEQQVGSARLGQAQRLRFLQSVELNCDLSIGQRDEVDAQVVVQIAGGHGLYGSFCWQSVGRGMDGATLFLQVHRRLTFPGDDDVEHVVVVPVVRHQLEGAGDLSRDAGGLADVLEIQAAEIAKYFQPRVLGLDREQIKFAGEIDVRDQRIDCLQGGEPREAGHVARKAVGGESIGVRPLIADH